MEKKQETKKIWWVVEFDVESSQEDLASWLMIQQGANGCQFIDSKQGYVTLQASFDENRLAPDNMQALYSALDEYGLGKLASNLRINKLEEQDWLAEWKKGMQPLKLGEKFLVSPPWFEGKIETGILGKRHIIWIEPGLAFGTGFHATTQFCLRSVEKYLSSAKSILDVGTGSGILAVAVLHLRPQASVTALETDPLACKVAKENFELNKVSARVTLIEGSTERVLSRTFDAILANLTCEDNIALLAEYATMLKSGAIAILSGILAEKLSLIESELSKHPFETLEKECGETWAGLVLKRR